MKFEELTHETKLEMLKSLQKFKLPNNPVFLHCGTLLGSVRENAFIDHDDDVDIAYLSNYHTIPEVKSEMLEIYKYLSAEGLLIKYFDLNYNSVLNADSGIDGLGQAHVLVDDLVFDLWTTWVDNDGKFNLFDMSQISDSPLPLRKSYIYDLEFSAPRNAEVILEAIYGNDWCVPRVMKPEQKKFLFKC